MRPGFSSWRQGALPGGVVQEELPHLFSTVKIVGDQRAAGTMSKCRQHHHELRAVISQRSPRVTGAQRVEERAGGKSMAERVQIDGEQLSRAPCLRRVDVVAKQFRDPPTSHPVG